MISMRRRRGEQIIPTTEGGTNAQKWNALFYVAIEVTSIDGNS